MEKLSVIHVREYIPESRMDNPEKLATLGTERGR